MKIHFISIGGSVMHQLAIALKRKQGYTITGSDDEIFEPSRSILENEGLLPQNMGWDPSYITKDLDAVILGMHAKDDNPELLKAKELGLNIYSFPEYIYQESRYKTRIAIGGSHGKTTTTSMIMHVLKEAGKKFDWLVGARLEGFEHSVNITSAPVIVCEADEYPASAIEKKPKFHFLNPHIAVLTGIAWDHINVFPTFEIYLEQFRIFITKIETGGQLIYNESDEILKKLVEESKRDDIWYQPYNLPEHRIIAGITELNIEGVPGTLKVFGSHNLLNISAAWNVCKELEVDAETFVKAISNFTGASKRLEVLAHSDHTRVFRDFAHAPSKVKATIDALKEQYPHKKLIAILELHTYSSLNENFMAEYNGSMAKADKAVVFYSRHALELKRMPELPKSKVFSGFAKPGLLVMNERPELEKWLNEQEYTNAVLVFMSSGNYDGLDVPYMAQKVLLLDRVK